MAFVLYNFQRNAVIGNPPYNIIDGSGGATDGSMPIYQNFIEIAKSINPSYISMIFPAKWMVGGRGLDSFRTSFLKDKHLSHLFDYEDASFFFTGIHIDGGLNYILWDKSYNDVPLHHYHTADGYVSHLKRELDSNFFKFIIRDARITSILEKTKSTDSFSSIVSSRKPYGIAKDLFNSPERYPTSNLSSDYFKGSIKIYGVKGLKGGAKRQIGYVSKEIVINSINTINKYKIFFTTSYSADAVVPPQAIEASPNEICTETFLLIGPFNTEVEMKNCHSYIQSTFFKFLLYYGHGTMQVTKSVFGLIPLQKFTQSWSDKELYAKYNLTPEEIKFIEDTISTP